jgi:hypothetical protein
MTIDMKKPFEEQLKTNKLISENILKKLHKKTYTNGDPIKVGDQVLYAFREGKIIKEDENGVEALPIEIVTLNKDQIDQYEVKLESVQLQMPMFKAK